MSRCYTCKAPLDIPEPKNLEEQRVFCENCGITTIVASRKAVWEAGERMRAETFRRLGIRQPAPFADVEWTEDGMVGRTRRR